MRKWITVAFIASFIPLLIFYSNGVTNHAGTASDILITCPAITAPIEGVDDQDQTSDQDFNDLDLDSSGDIEEVRNYNPALELLSEGRMDGIEFAGGADGKDIVSRRGAPDFEENFMGGLLLAYGETYFLTDGSIYDDHTSYGTVVSIYYTGKEAVYGICAGMSSQQVKDALGSPNDTYISEGSELYPDGSLIAVYKAGKYTAAFVMNGESETVQSIWIHQTKI